MLFYGDENEVWFFPPRMKSFMDEKLFNKFLGGIAYVNTEYRYIFFNDCKILAHDLWYLPESYKVLSKTQQ